MYEKATIYKVAQLSGFSTATVSRVMHNNSGFSETTRETVLAAASELGWVPNHSARSLARRRSGILGVLFRDFGADGTAESESPLYVDQVIRGAERVATTAGDAVLIAATRGRGGQELARSIVDKVDGLVILAGSLPDKDVVAISARVPVIVLAAHTARLEADFVGADNRHGTCELTSHLVTRHQIRDLGFVAGPARSSASNERFLGFCQALADAGIDAPSAAEVHGGFTEGGGARAVEHLLSRRPSPPRAIVFGNDEMAVGGLGVLRSHGLRVPADVAITGFDDIATARHMRPPLTTVRQPMRDIGETAMRTLLDRLSEPAAPRRTVMLPTELVVRSSCGCPPPRRRTSR